MTSSPIFLQRWDASFGDSPLVAHRLRILLPDRWVRFHSLPDSKRYAENDEEWAILLRRWNQVIGDVLGTESGWLVALRVEGEEPGWLSNTLGDGVPIPPGPRTTSPECDPWEMQSWPYRHVDGALNPWLRRLADWDTVNTLFVDSACQRLAAPYDGGIDVIAASESERDGLRDRYAEWLSSHPRGL